MRYIQATWYEFWFAGLEAVLIMVPMFILAEALRMLIFHVGRSDEKPKWAMAVAVACTVIVINALNAAIIGPWEGAERLDRWTAIVFAFPVIIMTWFMWVQCIAIYLHYTKKTP